MADVSVTLKLSVSDFDLVRKAVTECANQFALTKRDEPDPKERTRLMQTIAQLRELERKLN